MEISRIEIRTIDRPFMTYDISGVFVRHQVDIIWMEIYTHVVYIKFNKLDEEIRKIIMEEISQIEGVYSVNELNLLSFEKREIEIRTVMDSVWQGLIILNNDRTIKYINKYALDKVFRMKENEVINQGINKIFDNNTNELEKMIDKAENTTKVQDKDLKIKNMDYMISVNSMMSEKKSLLGFVITLQDAKRMNQILNNKRYDNQITFDDIVGNSESIKYTINQAKVFSQSDSPVLILGESGTGKELFARSIHNLSSRSCNPFVAVNCGAIPDQLLESELFGYEGGSFTGAKSTGKTGLFEIAKGGTLFLDEIGEMPSHLQVKLLRVLQEKKIRKIGSNEEKVINVRIISATNKDLNKMVNENQFRLDLFYRINIFTLFIPSLRERPDDIKVLADYYINEFSEKYSKKIDDISKEALEKLLDYYWVGNVRELQNVIERSVALNYSGKINSSEIILSDNLEKSTIAPKFDSLKETLENVEKNIIVEALKKSDSIRSCAKSLGVTHTLLINRMKKYSIIKK